ncbi:MAG TPA: hypothetical protein VIL95_06210 [Bacillota bacterium]
MTRQHDGPKATTAGRRPPVAAGGLSQRVCGACLVLGTVGFATLSALHPPTFDPRAVRKTVQAILAEPFWALLHWGLLAAVLVLACGLAGLHHLLRASGAAVWSPWARAFTWASTTLWSAIFVAEAAGGTTLARGLARGWGWPSAGGSAALPEARLDGAAAAAIEGIAGALWSSTLAIGYVAAFLLALAIGLWSLDLARTRLFGDGPARLGLWAAAAALPAQPLAWFFPAAALWLLVPPTFGLAVWTLWLGTILLKTARPRGQAALRYDAPAGAGPSAGTPGVRTASRRHRWPTR